MKHLAYAIVILAALSTPLLETASAEPAVQTMTALMSCPPYHLTPDPPYVQPDPGCIGARLP
ncbi:MAG: hypothetical protein QOI63_1190 [Thermoplasmata archaeon]|jgi:hypothetical protein|nr:hypothetical protein [Thermoplasmata archaeon]